MMSPFGQVFAAQFGPYALPNGTEPLVFSDFENGAYVFDGASSAVTDLWVTDSDWATFDPETQVEADIGFHGGATLSPAAAALLDIGSGLTIIMIASLDGTSSAQRAYVELSDAPDFNNEQIATFFNAAGLGVEARLSDAGGNATTATLLALADDHKLAANIFPTSMALSVEGSANLTATPSLVIPTKMFLQTEGAARIRSIGIYPAQPDADLPMLSAL